MNLCNLKVKEIESGKYSEISKITFEDGTEIRAEEDTGGEYAYMVIDGYELKIGDMISFDYELDEFDCICNLEWVEVYDKLKSYLFVGLDVPDICKGVIGVLKHFMTAPALITDILKLSRPTMIKELSLLLGKTKDKSIQTISEEIKKTLNKPC